jgi:hypothetical protein
MPLGVYTCIVYLTMLSVAQPLWYSGQNYWIQIQRSGFHSRWVWNGVHSSLMSTIEELLEINSSGSV